MTLTVGDRATERYEQIAAASAGTPIDSVVEYLHVDRLAEYGDLVDARRAAFGTSQPSVVTVVTEHLFAPDEHLRVDVRPAGSGPDGVVRLPLVLPIDDAGDVVAPDDFRGQYRFCLERAATLLEGLGLSLAHLVQTIDFSTPATRDVYSKCGHPRRDLLGPVYPGAAGILVSALPRPGALVGFEFVASRYLPAAVNPGWARYETLTYNPAVRAGDGLFGSGFAALDPVTQQAVHADDPAAQTTYTYASILAVLAAAGAGPEQLTEITEYVTPTGVPAIERIAGARQASLAGSPAVVTTVGCATLLRPEFAIEIIPTAVLPGGGA